MKDKRNGNVLLIGFYIRGALDSPVSNPAIEITNSVYVSMHRN